MAHAMRCMLGAGYKTGALAIIHQSGSPPRPSASTSRLSSASPSRLRATILLRILSLSACRNAVCAAVRARGSKAPWVSYGKVQRGSRCVRGGEGTTAPQHTSTSTTAATAATSATCTTTTSATSAFATSATTATTYYYHCCYYYYYYYCHYHYHYHYCRYYY